MLNGIFGSRTGRQSLVAPLHPAPSLAFLSAACLATRFSRVSTRFISKFLHASSSNNCLGVLNTGSVFSASSSSSCFVAGFPFVRFVPIIGWCFLARPIYFVSSSVNDTGAGFLFLFLCFLRFAAIRTSSVLEGGQISRRLCFGPFSSK